MYCGRWQVGKYATAPGHRRAAGTSNWLPAPAAPFRPIMRLYQPRPAILNGTYRFPPITKVAR